MVETLVMFKMDLEPPLLLPKRACFAATVLACYNINQSLAETKAFSNNSI